MTDRKLIIFDLDGTLVEFLSGYLTALKEFSETRGLPYDPVKVAKGYTHPDKIDLGWGVPISDQKELIDEMNVFYCDELTDNNRFLPEMYPGIKEELKALSEEYDLAVVTARNRKSFLYVVDHYKITDLFVTYRTLCCAADRKYPMKPAPDAVNCVLKETGHKLENVVVIGDTSSDIEMANAAGVKSIAALWDAAAIEKVKAANPTMTLDQPNGLRQAVKNVFALVA